jgi:hypothetical protein
MYVTNMTVDEYVKNTPKVKAEVEKINAGYSFADVVNQVVVSSRDNEQTYFNLLWQCIPDEYLYETYKQIFLDVSSRFYFRMFANDLLEKVRMLNKRDTVDNPALRSLLDSDGYLTVYHGHVKKTLQNSHSWTTAPEIAHFFGCRNADRQRVDDYNVVTGKVKLDDVIAYITERDEREIGVLNKDVRDKKKELFKLSETNGKYRMLADVIKEIPALSDFPV